MDLRLLLSLLALTAVLTAGCTSDEPGENMDGDEGDPDGGTGDNSTADDGAIPQPGVGEPVSATVMFSGFYGPPGGAGTEYTESITVVQGVNLTVTFENDDQNAAFQHDWYLEELDVGTDAIEAGESVSVTFMVDLEPGNYPYYCSIGNHRDNGMEGTLIVTERT